MSVQKYFYFNHADKNVHNLLHYRRNVRNAQQGITALDQWEPTVLACLELTLPCCAPGDITAPKVRCESAAAVTRAE